MRFKIQVHKCTGPLRLDLKLFWGNLNNLVTVGAIIRFLGCYLKFKFEISTPIGLSLGPLSKSNVLV